MSSTCSSTSLAAATTVGGQLGSTQNRGNSIAQQTGFRLFQLLPLASKDAERRTFGAPNHHELQAIRKSIHLVSQTRVEKSHSAFFVSVGASGFSGSRRLCTTFPLRSSSDATQVNGKNIITIIRACWLRADHPKGVERGTIRVSHGPARQLSPREPRTATPDILSSRSQPRHIPRNHAVKPRQNLPCRESG